MHKLSNEEIALSILVACLLLAGGVYFGQKIKPRPPLSPEEKRAVKAEVEKKEIQKTARQYLKVHSAPGTEFNLRIVNQTEDWALLETAVATSTASAAPVLGEIDSSTTIILEKMNGRWRGRAMGATLPQWEEKLPDLFSPPCQNLCGDGLCQEVVCQALGCPCAESASNCPMDCEEKNKI